MGDSSDRSIRPACLKRTGYPPDLDSSVRDDSSRCVLERKTLVLAASFFMSVVVLGLFCAIRCALFALSISGAKEKSGANQDRSTILVGLDLENASSARK